MYDRRMSSEISSQSFTGMYDRRMFSQIPSQSSTCVYDRRMLTEITSQSFTRMYDRRMLSEISSHSDAKIPQDIYQVFCCCFFCSFRQAPFGTNNFDVSSPAVPGDGG